MFEVFVVGKCADRIVIERVWAGIIVLGVGRTHFET